MRKCENKKLYCHFYNNKKTCPYNDECVFLHEHSRLCKYGSYCEREYCMFKHECKNKEIETVNVAEEIIEIADDQNEVLDEADAISVIVDVDVHENIIDCDSMEINEKSENMKEVDDEIDILQVDNNIGADLNLSNINNIDDTSGGKRIFACQLCNYQAVKNLTLLLI